MAEKPRVSNFWLSGLITENDDAAANERKPLVKRLRLDKTKKVITHEGYAAMTPEQLYADTIRRLVERVKPYKGVVQMANASEAGNAAARGSMAIKINGRVWDLHRIYAHQCLLTTGGWAVGEHVYKSRTTNSDGAVFHITLLNEPEYCLLLPQSYIHSRIPRLACDVVIRISTIQRDNLRKSSVHRERMLESPRWANPWTFLDQWPTT